MMSRARLSRTQERGRLVYHGPPADDPAYWTAHWTTVDVARSLAAAENGYLGDYEAVFLNHLPRRGAILEAGCGYGRYVSALAARGYDVLGVEFSEETVRQARQVAPGLSIQVGDILHLDFADETFAAYVSLGVVEHFPDGPEPALREALRVLRPDGTLICSVPYYNPLRRRKLRRRPVQARGAAAAGSGFYQYAFTQREFGQLLASVGFRPIDVCYHGLAKGLKDEIPAVHAFQRSGALASRLLWHLGRLPWYLPRRCAHMITFVARKA